MSWDALRGDARVRFCTRCSLNVYNLADMALGEVEEAVRNAEGKLCVRLYDRGDGTATTEDCRAGRARKKKRIAFVVAALLAVSAFASILRSQGKPDRSCLPPLVRRIVDWIDPEPKFLMGAPMPLPAPKTPIPPPPADVPEEP